MTDTTMNAPIYHATSHEHLLASLERPAPEFIPEPRPTRADAEFVVDGIEARATVRAAFPRSLWAR